MTLSTRSMPVSLSPPPPPHTRFLYFLIRISVYASCPTARQLYSSCLARPASRLIHPFTLDTAAASPSLGKHGSVCLRFIFPSTHTLAVTLTLSPHFTSLANLPKQRSTMKLSPSRSALTGRYMSFFSPEPQAVRVELQYQIIPRHYDDQVSDIGTYDALTGTLVLPTRNDEVEDALIACIYDCMFELGGLKGKNRSYLYEMPSVGCVRLRKYVESKAPQFKHFFNPHTCTWQDYLRSIGIVCFIYKEEAYEDYPPLALLAPRGELRCASRLLTLTRQFDRVLRLEYVRPNDNVTAMKCWRALSLPRLVSACVSACRSLASSPMEAFTDVTNFLIAAMKEDAAAYLGVDATAVPQSNVLTVCRLANVVSKRLESCDHVLATLSTKQRRRSVMWALHWMTRVSFSTAYRSSGLVSVPPGVALSTRYRQVVSRMVLTPALCEMKPPGCGVADKIVNVNVGACSVPLLHLVQNAWAPTEETLPLCGEPALNLASWLQSSAAHDEYTVLCAKCHAPCAGVVAAG